MANLDEIRDNSLAKRFFQTNKNHKQYLTQNIITSTTYLYRHNTFQYKYYNQHTALWVISSNII